MERSLVRRVEARAEEPRFTMLETIREFSLERLAEAGEDETVRCGRAEYFAKVAETAGARFFGPEELLWLDRCETDSGNLSSALSWSATHDPEPGFRMAGSLWWFWHTRAGLSLGRSEVERLLARRTEAPTPLVAKALQTLGLLATFQPDHVTARRAFEESQGLFDELGDEQESTLTTFFRGMLEQQSVGSEDGDRLMQRALAGFQRLGNRVWEGIALFFLGTSAAFVRPDSQQRKPCRVKRSVCCVRWGTSRV